MRRVSAGGHSSSAGSRGGADSGEGHRPEPEPPASAPESLAAGTEATEWFDPATPPQSPTARDGCAATEWLAVLQTLGGRAHLEYALPLPACGAECICAWCKRRQDRHVQAVSC